jgi:DHA1 family tetracycline resistance protein-like MFS transporter
MTRESDSAPTPEARDSRRAMSFIFVAVLLDMLAAGITLPVVPAVIRQLIGGDLPATARYVGGFAALWAAVHFFAAPVIGALSDRFGRRPVLVASMLGQAVDYAAMALAPTVAWLFVGRAVSGALSSSTSTASAYVTDITPPERRAGRMGLLSAAFGLGLIAGPALGGLLGRSDPRLPFWVAGGLCLLNGLWGLFVLPESLRREHRARFDPRLANPWGSFELYAARAGLLALISVIFLSYLAQQVLYSAAIPYVTYRYDWTPDAIGLALMLMGLGVVAVTLTVRPLVARIGERRSLGIALVAGAAGMGVYGAAPSGAVFMLGIPVLALIGLVGPAASSLMTRQVGPHEQGRLQGANASVIAISAIAGPLIFGEVFARSIAGWSGWAPVGLVFYVSAAFLAAAVAIAAMSRPPGSAAPFNGAPTPGG